MKRKEYSLLYYSLLIAITATLTAILIINIQGYQEQLKMWANFGIMLTSILFAFLIFILSKK
ncbi:hypothetical protein HOD38_05765 [archaeon]|jgi:hypothetical protein|nr:hypothetical protein [archaeon]MBT4397744.1 hypothetical protein [archaeon]MBT4441235.1 hypothetical protein [archaeon]